MDRVRGGAQIGTADLAAPDDGLAARAWHSRAPRRGSQSRRSGRRLLLKLAVVSEADALARGDPAEREAIDAVRCRYAQDRQVLDPTSRTRQTVCAQSRAFPTGAAGAPAQPVRSGTTPTGRGNVDAGNASRE